VSLHDQYDGVQAHEGQANMNKVSAVDFQPFITLVAKLSFAILLMSVCLAAGSVQSTNSKMLYESRHADGAPTFTRCGFF
jgi:hypothetical protein